MSRDSKILVILGFAILLGAFSWRATQTGGRSEEPGDALSPFSSLATHDASPAVVVVFSARDCGTLVESLRFWNESHQSGEVNVNGWVYGPRATPASLDKVVRGAGLRFPVRIVEDGSLRGIRRTLGYGSGSFVVALSSTGHVRLALPLSYLGSPDARLQVRSFVAGLE